MRFAAFLLVLVVLNIPLLSAQTASTEPPRLVLPTPHGKPIYQLAVMPDGRFAVSGTSAGEIKLWDVATGTELKSIALRLPEEKSLLTLLVRHATQVYAVVSDRVLVLDIPSLEIASTIESRHPIVTAQVSHDGESLWLGSSTDRKSILQVIRRGRFPIRLAMERERAVDAVRGGGVPYASPDGRYAIIVDSSKQPPVLVRIEDAQDVHTLPQGVEWSIDSRLVSSRPAGAGRNINIVEVFNPDTLQVESSAQIPTDSDKDRYYLRGQSRPGGPLILRSSKRFVLVDDGKVDGPYHSPNSDFTALAEIDSRHLLCATSERDGRIDATVNQLQKFDRARASFSAPWSTAVHQTVLFTASPRGDTFFVTGHDTGKLIQLDRGGLRISNVPVRKSFDAVFTPDGKFIIHYGGQHDDRLSTIIPVNTPGSPRSAKMPFERVARGVWGNIVSSPSGKLVVDIRSGTTPVTVYDPYTGIERRSFQNGHYGYDRTSGSAAISPDDTRVVYFALAQNPDSRSIRCYNIATGALVWSRTKLDDDFANFRFSDDGKEVFAIQFGFKRRLLVLNADTGETIREHALLTESDQAAQAIFSPSGTEIAMPFGDSIVFLSTTDGKELRRATAPGQRVETLCYMGDGRIASTGPDKAIRLWDTARAELLGTISFSADGKDWAFIHPSGRFEATQGFQEQMYFVQGSTKIPLAAYSESYHTPGLVGQILTGETIAVPIIQLKDLTEPPKVFVTLVGSTRNLFVEDAPEKVTGEQATLRITAQSEQSKISEIRLYHNGKLVESRTRNLTVEDDIPDVDVGHAGRSENVTVILLPGENTFRAVALNEQRTESAPAFLALDYKPSVSASATLAGRDGGGLQLHLLVIGVNTYRNPKYNLNYAVPDATAVRDLVQKNAGAIFTKINVTTLFNEKATRPAILEAFAAIAQKSGPRDVFVFYYAGHGVMSSDAKPEFFLAPHELTQLYGDDDQLRAKAVSSAELLAASAKISAQKQLFLLDACQSAGALQTVAMRGAAEEKAVAQLARASGTHWITASGSEQFATEFEKLGHGTFTYALLEALNGKADNGDDRITVNELKAYLESAVPELTRLHKGTPQYPASYGFGQDFPLSIISKN